MNLSDIRQSWEKLNKIRVIWLTLTVLFVIALFILFVEFVRNPESHVNDLLPCPYLNSIDISGGERLPNGSFEFNNIIYPEGLYAKVDFVRRHDANGESFYEYVEPYYRGCICNITSCMYICYTGDGANNCKANISHADVQQELNEEFETSFQYVNEKSCHETKWMTIDDEEYEMANNEFLYDDEVMEPVGYLATYNISSKEKRFFICLPAKETNLRKIILTSCMFISVAFIIATFFVYICLPELRNLNGKCLLCYLVSLAIAFSFNGWLLINDSNYVEPILCRFNGYCMYFAFQLAFFWLNVICFDLWWNFRRTNGFILSERKRFFFYNIYAWGAALILTLFIFLLDHIGMSENWRPNIGGERCFLQEDVKRIFLYFYLPLLILCTLNIGFFTMTAVTIRHLQIEMRKIVSKDESRKHRKKLQKDKDNITLFLRLFIVMGVGWIMEAISYLIDGEHLCFIVFDIWNASAGISIFVCMVVKRRVFRLMKKRWRGVFGRSLSTEDPATHSSTVTGDPSGKFPLQRLTSNISVAKEPIAARKNSIW